jgi:hypothetical protein
LLYLPAVGDGNEMSDQIQLAKSTRVHLIDGELGAWLEELEEK